ncbi:MAG: O-antigen ligase family protein [Planctomycetota bacterium]
MKTDTNLQEKHGHFLENIFLALSLCIVALRTTFTESPNFTIGSVAGSYAGAALSIAVSGTLIFSSLIYLCYCCTRKIPQFRMTGMEIPILLFAVASAVSLTVASNKRAAVNDIITMLAPMLMAVLLVQLLDSPNRIKLLLYVIVTFGAVSAYQCISQFFSGNELMIEQYKQDPNFMLAPLGLEAGSYHHMLFEHRLYSKDTPGFFTTSNSAGSFLMLASFAAIALLLEKIRIFRTHKNNLTHLITSAVVTAFVITGLFITQSKGAIGAAIITSAMLTTFFILRNWLTANKKTVLVVCIIAVIVIAGLIMLYGLINDTLPGGKTMLVRWQYWTGAAKMFARHPYAGVGPANFSTYYPKYKIPAAPETVTDPHNFILSILTQYGPLGLLAFLAAVTVPLLKIIFAGKQLGITNPAGESPFRKLALSFLVLIVVVILFIRPLFVPSQLGNSPAVIAYVILLLYVTPAAVLILAFLLLSTREKPAVFDSAAIAILACSLIGLLIHNCIDFAIFEPAVLTAFWAVLACVVALHYHVHGAPPPVRPHLIVRIALIIASLAAGWAYFNYALIPVANSNAKTQLGRIAVARSASEAAFRYFHQATQDDPLNPTPPFFRAQFELQLFKKIGPIYTELLENAIEHLKIAIGRNPAEYKYYEKLAQACKLMAESKPQQKDKWLPRAFTAASTAAELYPGSAEIHLDLARLAQQIGQTDIALQHYKIAVDIEESYRRQFRVMYPSEKIFSRLGEDNYLFARKQIETLSQNPLP